MALFINTKFSLKVYLPLLSQLFINFTYIYKYFFTEAPFTHHNFLS